MANLLALCMVRLSAQSSITRCSLLLYRTPYLTERSSQYQGLGVDDWCEEPVSILTGRLNLFPYRTGYVSYIGRYASKNAVLADILESCGAVLYVKTNVPQTLMVWRFEFLLGQSC